MIAAQLTRAFHFNNKSITAHTIETYINQTIVCQLHMHNTVTWFPTLLAMYWPFRALRVPRFVRYGEVGGVSARVQINLPPFPFQSGQHCKLYPAVYTTAFTSISQHNKSKDTSIT